MGVFFLLKPWCPHFDSHQTGSTVYMERFSYDTFWDHLQTCQTKSEDSKVQEWVVYKLGAFLGSVGHRVKIHKITTAMVFTRSMYTLRNYLNRGILDRFCHRLNTPCLDRQQLTFHVQQIIQTSSVQDLDPHPCADNAHTSVLPHELESIEPGENPTRTLTWKSLTFLNHIKRRTNDDRFPLPLWETWFCSNLGVQIPTLIDPPQQCACNSFHYDTYGDHLQSCQTQSPVLQTHDWVVYILGDLFGSVGHKVKIHKIIVKERGDNEIKDHVVLQKPQGQDNRRPPPRTLIMDFTVSHVRFGYSHLHPIGQLTHTRCSDGTPDPDGPLKATVQIKIRHYRNIYLNRSDATTVLSVTVDTSGGLYDDFVRLIFLHAHLETTPLANKLLEESDQFRFLRATCLGNLKGSVDLILVKT